MVDWDLVLIALLAEDEERQIRTANLTNRQLWVHNLWRTRSTNGEFSNLFNDLRYDIRKFYDYYRMDYEKFEKLSDLLKSHIKKIKTNFRSPIPVTERLSVCLRLVHITYCMRWGHRLLNLQDNALEGKSGATLKLFFGLTHVLFHSLRPTFYIITLYSTV
ncbi:unnamed protein product [Pieris brassicae]|uniref:Uncharacterized protein n=1 Tax=Pieris brassicae TaxID=7116 RepID=A0A9P0TVM3_PIEBR|nr:unnamed protein product [Pieris brassicae]CAH4034285.1 unnamed protein product [Pieris brassicae]